MSFYLYAKTADTYRLVSALKLTGKSGLIAQYLRSHAREETPFSWQIGLKELLALVDPELPVCGHELVFDMLPEAFTEICLYRVDSFRGVSGFDETDMVLSCRILEQGALDRPACEFKAGFTLSNGASSRELVEAFHVSGGVVGGSYYWGKPKMNIGAAICPPASKPEAV